MGWKHIVVEGHCMHGIEEEDSIPKNCLNSPGNVGTWCLTDEETEHSHCKFFAFGKAKASVVVTDGEGEAEYGKCFYPTDAFNLTNEEWDKRENIWIDMWKNKIINDNSENENDK
jgi:hypothetical protein